MSKYSKPSQPTVTLTLTSARASTLKSKAIEGWIGTVQKITGEGLQRKHFIRWANHENHGENGEEFAHYPKRSFQLYSSRNQYPRVSERPRAPPPPGLRVAVRSRPPPTEAKKKAKQALERHRRKTMRQETMIGRSSPGASAAAAVAAVPMRPACV